jgi:chromosome segregation ATPase
MKTDLIKRNFYQKNGLLIGTYFDPGVINHNTNDLNNTTDIIDNTNDLNNTTDIIVNTNDLNNINNHINNVNYSINYLNNHINNDNWYINNNNNNIETINNQINNLINYSNNYFNNNDLNNINNRINNINNELNILNNDLNNNNANINNHLNNNANLNNRINNINNELNILNNDINSNNYMNSQKNAENIIRQTEPIPNLNFYETDACINHTMKQANLFETRLAQGYLRYDDMNSFAYLLNRVEERRPGGPDLIYYVDTLLNEIKTRPPYQ